MKFVHCLVYNSCMVLYTTLKFGAESHGSTNAGAELKIGLVTSSCHPNGAEPSCITFLRS